MGIFSDFFDSMFGDDDDIIDMDDILDMAGGDRGFLGNLLEYFTGNETGQGIASLLGSYALNQSGLMDPKIPQTGYQGGIPDYTVARRQVPVATGIEQINQTVRPMGTTRMEAGDVESTGRVMPLRYDPNRRPGSGGRRYFTDIDYVSTGRDLGEDKAVDSAAMTAAQGRQEQQAYDLLRRNLSNPAREERSKRVGGLPLMAGPMPAGPQGQPQDPVESGDRAGQLPPDQDGSFQEGGRVAKTNPFAKTAKEFFKTRGEERYFSGMMPEVRQATSEAKGASPEERAEIMQYMELELMREYFPDEYRQKGHDPRAYKVPTNPKPSGNDRKMAQGGITALKKGTYLNGNTDGMADKVPATIEGKQPAALSDGEFVIPADVVSHLGNGNSDAGAKILEQMMARVRKERTGNKEQGKEINARNMLPV